MNNTGADTLRSRRDDRPRRGKRHDGDVFINPAHVALVEPSSVGDGKRDRHSSSPPQAGARREMSAGLPRTSAG